MYDLTLKTECTFSPICAILIERLVHFLFKTIQRFYGSTAKQPLDVRTDTLTPYGLTPYGRTTTDLTTYFQRISIGKNGPFSSFNCHFFGF